MKKILLIISILLLALLPVYCSGSPESKNPIMELFQKTSLKVSNPETSKQESLSKNQLKPLEIQEKILEKQKEQSVLSSEDLAALKQVQTIVNNAEKLVYSTKEDLIKANETIKTNQEKIEILEREDDNKTLQITELKDSKAKLIVENSKKDGRITELEKITGSKGSFELGCLYNLESGYQAGFDLGYKFKFGLKTSIGAYVPVEETIKDPFTLLKPVTYTFSAKIGWEF